MNTISDSKLYICRKQKIAYTVEHCWQAQCFVLFWLMQYNTGKAYKILQGIGVCLCVCSRQYTYVLQNMLKCHYIHINPNLCIDNNMNILCRSTFIHTYQRYIIWQVLFIIYNIGIERKFDPGDVYAYRSIDQCVTHHHNIREINFRQIFFRPLQSLWGGYDFQIYWFSFTYIDSFSLYIYVLVYVCL